jgi:hypothetical protein
VGRQQRSRPAEAAVPLLDLAFEPVKPGHYGEPLRNGEVLAWRIMHTDYRRPIETFDTTISAVVGLHFYRMA